MKKTYAVLNTLVIIGVIFWNYYSNTGAINGVTIGELSDQYSNLFTPAGYAFAIWGLIFAGLILLGVYLLKLAFFNHDHSEIILKIGPWLLIANLGNAAWLWFWLHEQTGITVLIMLVILIALLQIVLRLDMQLIKVSWQQKALVWWPIAIYSGWITVATIANIAAYLAKIEWLAVLSEVQWTVLMISIAGVINLWVIYKRKMYAFGLVGIWALTAIAVKHWGQQISIQYTAVFWAVVLLIGIGIWSFVSGIRN